jgi:serine protease AprX
VTYQRAISFGLFLFLLIGSAEAESSQVSGPVEPSLILADLNQNRLSDGLEANLANARPDERFAVVVSFTGPGNSATAQQVIGNFEVRREFGFIRAFAATMRAAQIQALAGVAGVFRIEEDFPVSISLDAANRDFGAKKARSDFWVDGLGSVICVVDTGVDPAHEQLDSKTLLFYDAIAGNLSAYDDHGHGTHVASIAAGDGIGLSFNAGTFKGVAPGADVYAAKVLDASGNGRESDVIAGIQWCAQQPLVDIISMSLASPGGSDGQDALSQAVNEAVNTYKKLVVVAAGNFGAAPETVSSPGAAELAITVGAAAEYSAPPWQERHSDGVYLAVFSSRGPTLDGRIKPDIIAPGHNITAAEANTNGYVTFSGTSMATPFVSGTIALGYDANPFMTPEQIRSALQGTAHDRGPAGKDNDWGTGLLDVYAFVADVQSALYEPTAFPTYQRVSGSVPSNGLWSFPFVISQDDLDVPIGATITIDGDLSCSFSLFGICFAWEWSLDLDARLLDPNGTEIAFSGCPGLGDECGGVGRQETLRSMPTMAGTYTIELWPYAESPNNGKGGSFVLDLSTGPVNTATSPPGDTAPTSSIVSPPAGSTITGDITIQVNATDVEDTAGTLTVEGSIDDGSWQSANYNNNSGYYELSWNTVAFVDGIHTISARATDSGNNTGNTGQVTVTVENSPQLTSITVTPISASIEEGQTQQFTATGTFSDSSTADLILKRGRPSSSRPRAPSAIRAPLI